MKLGTETGSVFNHIYSRATLGQPTPEVGMGATLLGWTDRNAATIRNVLTIKNKMAVQVTQDNATVISGSVQDGSAEYKFETVQDAKITTFVFDNDAWVQYVVNPETNRWNKVKGGRGLRIGERDEYYDPCF